MDPPEYVPGTSEIGSITANSNEDSQFVGSSSGVYFVNTVRRAFSTGQDTQGSPETEFPPAEDTLVGAEDSPQQKRRPTASSSADSTSPQGAREDHAYWRYDPTIASALGQAPPLELSKELMMMYFKVWHPLFPFLHGPTFLQAMEGLYSSETPDQPSQDTLSSDHRSLCWTVVFQCIFNLGNLLRLDLELPAECRIQSPTNMTSLLAVLATRHDIASLQALLSVQVYLIATMSLRLASTFGGCVLRSVLHAGLHRCPFRYTQLSSHDRQLRKRIFWCAYAIDRYLSQALGLPLGIQDSDIDVCLPAASEIHTPRRRYMGWKANEDLQSASHTPVDSSENGKEPVPSRPSENRSRSASEAENRKKETVLASYVDSGTLTGRALEIFHKSILVRSVRRSSILFLVTDVHKWWNSLPLELQGKIPGNPIDTDSPFDFGPFFTVLYQHLILIIHRPSLSSDPTTAEFCSGLQTCIGAARAILAALKSQVDSRQALFWPGFLSAAWMSGLVLAFACQLNQYVIAKGLQEIDACSGFLNRMSVQWETARHCQLALSVLAAKIRQVQNDPDAAARAHSYTLRRRGEAEPLDPAEQREQKRAKLNRRSSEPHSPRGTLSDDALVRRHASQSDVSYPPAIAGFGNHTVMGLQPGLDSVQRHFQPVNLNGEPTLADTPSSLALDFQQTDASQLQNGPNFDLNMVDLLQGANFDSLFDIIGQQYPSF
ncbi:hypothetical protein N7509_003339 [Penicillium cosmopolitanum]|uniref:Xylanolytic transcriptional activator regulatory domain-containing protein n=1 Tax=Penicillium cosmopolitanum TaxID=1131564 RepID=A0A9X0BBD5_9EURO|nr:uncharacterized protein N7509_003339 [Penicillium cosmopolitanum]KAJ5403468.1 hypothetical protein N7509_003339 [Penicillium cosmopolitanum]